MRKLSIHIAIAVVLFGVPLLSAADYVLISGWFKLPHVCQRQADCHCQATNASGASECNACSAHRSAWRGKNVLVVRF